MSCNAGAGGEGSYLSPIFIPEGPITSPWPKPWPTPANQPVHVTPACAAGTAVWDRVKLIFNERRGHKAIKEAENILAPHPAGTSLPLREFTEEASVCFICFKGKMTRLISSRNAWFQLQKHTASAWELAQERFPDLLHEHRARLSYQPKQQPFTTYSAARGLWGCSLRLLLPANHIPARTHTVPFALQFP